MGLSFRPVLADTAVVFGRLWMEQRSDSARDVSGGFLFVGPPAILDIGQ